MRRMQISDQRLGSKVKKNEIVSYQSMPRLLTQIIPYE